VPTIDPTVLALLSIFGGVILTIIAGALGALIQHQREHSKWLRDQRLRVYTEFLAAHDGLIRINDSGSDPGTEQKVIRSVGAVQLVGPEDVSAAAVAHSQVMMGMVGAAIQRRQQRKGDTAATNDEVQAATVTRGEFMRLARQQVQQR
jgi:hypothetical protein